MEKAIDGLMYIYGLSAEKALQYAEDAKEILIQNERRANASTILEQAARLFKADQDSEMLGHNT